MSLSPLVNLALPRRIENGVLKKAPKDIAKERAAARAAANSRPGRGEFTSSGVHTAPATGAQANARAFTPFGGRGQALGIPETKVLRRDDSTKVTDESVVRGDAIDGLIPTGDTDSEDEGPKGTGGRPLARPVDGNGLTYSEYMSSKNAASAAAPVSASEAEEEAMFKRMQERMHGPNPDGDEEEAAL